MDSISPALFHNPTVLAAVVEDTPNGLCVIDRGGRLCLVNRAFQRMFGHSRDQLLGSVIDDLLPERYRQAHVTHRQRYFADPQQRSMGARMALFGLRADGTEFPVEVGLNPIMADGHIWVVASVVDTSDRRHMEDAFRTMVQGAPNAMLVVGDDGAILTANVRAEEVFGYEARELMGKTVDFLLPERYREGHPGLRAGYLDAPRVRSMGHGRDLTALHKDGRELPVEIGLSPVRWQGQRVVVASIIDLSKRKKMELDLRQANANLEEFTYVASHDLKSPLHGIADLVEWIAEDLEENEIDKVHANLKRVRIRVERMEQVIGDLLTYARAGRRSTELESISPQVLIDDILEIQPVPPHIEVTMDVSAGRFMGARTPLETALRNLISNAVKHHDKPKGKVHIAVVQDEHHCVFSVCDDGPGIPAKSRDRVFRLFQTLSNSERQGSGIGLALTKRLVESHGGRVVFNDNGSVPGVTFRVYWPRFQRRDLDDIQGD